MRRRVIVPGVGPTRCLLLLVLLTAGGCVNRITQPVELITPVTIYVADSGGKHSSLLLPDKAAAAGSEGYVHYAFGDWRCFALNKNGPLDYLRAAVASDRSALGREHLPTTRPDELRRLTAADLVPVVVEDADVSLLRRQLEARFARHSDEAIDNRTVRMTLVPLDDGPNRRYSIFNQCNTVTSRWLRRLNCVSPQAALLARFEVNGGM